jgi:iron complex outermembrane recepter protein
MSGRHTPRAGLAWLAALTLLRCAAARGAGGGDLTGLTLEQLMNEPVTSVSKKETPLSQSPAAITVVTQEDLRRMGITSLAEALRLVPGMDVARVASNQWAISARGFNNEFASKLLVLIDGRAVYTPTAAGVSWDSQDTVIEDVERIEVIRGPGATLWGANAVNGVINVITKRAADTQGVLVSALEGTEDKPALTVRYGGQLDPDLSYRVYAKFFDRDGFLNSTHQVDAGDWHTLQAGFRTDWKAPTGDDFTLQGDSYTGEAGQQIGVVILTPPAVVPVDVKSQNSGTNVLGRWTHTFSGDSSFTLQTYFDRVIQGYGVGTENIDTYDIDFEQRLGWGSRNDFVWGGGYRYAVIDEDAVVDLTLEPDRRSIAFGNLFIQDEITVIPDRLRVTLGSKLEHSDIGGTSVEPNVRVLWNPAEDQTVWASVSRATRTPSLVELDARVNIAAFPGSPGNPPTEVAIVGNPDLQSERLLAYELGYRLAVTPRASVDISGFLNRYDGEISAAAGTPQLEATSTTPYVLVPYVEGNLEHARTFGVETAAQWQVLPGWKLLASYTWLNMAVWPDSSESHESPHGQEQIRSYLDLPWHFELNSAVYHVSAISQTASFVPTQIPGYTRFDTGIVWKGSDTLSFGIWGQNLFDTRHVESVSLFSPSLIPVPQTYLLKLTWSH